MRHSLHLCSCCSQLVLQKQRRPRTANKQDDLDKVMKERMSQKHEEPLDVPTLNTAEDFEKAIKVSHRLGWLPGACCCGWVAALFFASQQACTLAGQHKASIAWRQPVSELQWWESKDTIGS